MNHWPRNIILMVLMLAASGLAMALRPTQRIADQGPKVDLEAMIPRAFGDWREEKQTSALIIDPSQQATLQKIYSQTLSRTFVNSNGYRIMLSIAYGRDQSDSVQLHYPEVCYPAQGFQLHSSMSEELHLSSGNIMVKRLQTSLSNSRVEPVTYWVMIGDQAIIGGAKKKLAEMRYGLKGVIPDGFLFRVSSIDPDNKNAFAMQTTFINELLVEASPEVRYRLSGLGGTPR